MGLMVEIPDMGIRGVVKREDLPQGRWRLESHRGAWAAADGRFIQAGMRLPLYVIGLDLERRFVDFAVADIPKEALEEAKPLGNAPRQVTGKGPQGPPRHKKKHLAPQAAPVKPGHHKALQKRRGKEGPPKRRKKRR